MRGEMTRRVELGVDLAAAATFAAATGFALFELLPPAAGRAGWDAPVALASALAFLLCRQALGRIGAEQPRFSVAMFEVVQVGPADCSAVDELLLTDEDRLDRSERGPDGAFVLDDILAEIGPDSRVVRLFDAAAMPTPGQLKTRIDQHLDAGPSSSPPPDASQALYQALAELRRSLR